MKITIEPTETYAESPGGIPCRLWRGLTDEGVTVVVFVAAVAVPEDVDSPELDRELRVMGTAPASSELEEAMAHAVDETPPSSKRQRKG
jgi:hypothetical protein